MKETKKNGAAQSKAGKRDYSAFKNMYRKIPQDLRDVIVYYIGDRPLVIHEGVNEVTGEVVTAEFIRQWHMDRDREVYNNNKHLKPPADENKKKQIREWEEAHPGEKCPDSYNLSLDASFADDEGSEDSTLPPISPAVSVCVWATQRSAPLSPVTVWASLWVCWLRLAVPRSV